jgi:methionyl-tRNA synthetase
VAGVGATLLRLASGESPTDTAIAKPVGRHQSSRRMSKQFYITTAIDYVNGEPHLGHAYEKIITDVIARIHRSLGEEVFFLTGLDEHGQKVKQAAVAEGMEPQAWCDKLATVWADFVSNLNLTHNDFVRTSSARHKAFVTRMLDKLNRRGHFYKASHTGFYSTKEETFLTDRDRGPDGQFDASWGEVIELSEDNWYFRMGKHQKWLVEHIEANPDFIAPDYRRNEILGFLRNEVLEDLCISRPITRLNWGIPLPFDPEFVTYVWFDALSNYTSVPAALGDPTLTQALGGSSSVAGHAQSEIELWPADIHVIGKDIVKFHAVYWPIMLKAMELPLPRQVLVHGWWQKEHQKMSKSTGNIVEPKAVTDVWGVDAFRYYVVRELSVGADGNWTDQGFESRYTAELANGLGNLVNRSLSMLRRYRKGVVPERSDELAAETADRVKQTLTLLRHHQLQAALKSIWTIVNRANQYVDQTAPFKLAKDPAQSERLDEILYNLAETCRLLAILIWPFIPDTAERINGQLGLEETPNRLAVAQWGGLTAGHSIGTPAVLFPRKDAPTG